MLLFDNRETNAEVEKYHIFWRERGLFYKISMQKKILLNWIFINYKFFLQFLFKFKNNKNLNNYEFNSVKNPGKKSKMKKG